jgi:3-(3-hydroxy-phenyl)propionate hydroxylase
MKTITSSDVILVGLGPTGVVLANLLGAQGWTVSVFEAATQIYELPRAVHFDDEAMRIFQMIGLAAEIEATTAKVAGMDMLNTEGALLARYIAPTGASPFGWHQGYMCDQPQVETILRQGLTRYPEVNVNLGCEVLAIEKQADGVEIQVRGAEGTFRHYAKFAIGCCGSRSIVRNAIGTGLKDFHADQRWLVVDVSLHREVELPSVTVQYCEPSRPSTFVPTPGKLRRFELMVMPDEDPQALLAPARLTQLLQRWLTPEDYSIHRAALYTFHALIAEKWRDGPLLIAGDAAHQMPPFLGQGLCAGVKDAANLAWKLDYVLQGIADARLLDTYQEEREAHVAAVIEADLWLSGIIQTTDVNLARQRDEQMLAADPAQNLLRPPVIPLGGALCQSAPPARLPFIQPVLPQGLLHDDLLGKGFALLGDIRPSDWAQSVLTHLSTYCSLTPEPQISEWLANISARAVLIRPDRYVLAILNDEEQLDLALQDLAQFLKIEELIN